MGCYLPLTDLLSHDDAAEESDGHVSGGVVGRGMLGEISIAMIQGPGQRFFQPARWWHPGVSAMQVGAPHFRKLAWNTSTLLVALRQSGNLTDLRFSS